MKEYLQLQVRFLESCPAFRKFTWNPEYSVAGGSATHSESSIFFNRIMVHLWHGLQGDGQKHKPHDTKYDYRLIPKYIITPGVGLDFEFHQDPSHNATLMVQRTKKFTRIRMDQGEFRASNRTNPQKKTLIESTNTPNDYLSHVGDRGSYSKSKVLQNGGFSDVATQKTETCHITYSTITHQRVSLKHQTHAKNICVYQFIIRFIT